MKKIQVLDDFILIEDFITKDQGLKTINLLNKLAEIRSDHWKPISFYESYSSGYPEDNDPILKEFDLPNNWFSDLYKR